MKKIVIGVIAVVSAGEVIGMSFGGFALGIGVGVASAFRGGSVTIGGVMGHGGHGHVMPYVESRTRRGTKIVMNIPEPETAKYMSSFLGEKEEVSTSEAISYGANTIRDGVNIAQKKEKKQTVPYSEIMNLQTGEAFLKLSGVQEIGKVQFRYHGK